MPRIELGGSGEESIGYDMDRQRVCTDEDETMIRVEVAGKRSAVEISSGRRILVRWKWPRWFAANIVSIPCGESS